MLYGLIIVSATSEGSPKNSEKPKHICTKGPKPRKDRLRNLMFGRTEYLTKHFILADWPKQVNFGQNTT